MNGTWVDGSIGIRLVCLLDFELFHPVHIEHRHRIIVLDFFLCKRELQRDDFISTFDCLKKFVAILNRMSSCLSLRRLHPRDGWIVRRAGSAGPSLFEKKNIHIPV